MNCPHCGNETAETNKYCTRCGKSIPHDDEDSTKILPKHKPLDTDPLKNEPQQEELGPNIDLRAILQSTLKWALVLGLATMIVYFSATFFAGIYIKSDPATVKHKDPILYILQAVLAGAFLLILFSPMGIPRKGNIRWDKRARKSYHQFLKGWSTIWMTWFLLYLYIGFTLLILKDVEILQNVPIQVTVDFLNASTSVAFLYVFIVLDMPSVATKDVPDSNSDFETGFRIIVLMGLVIFLFSSLGRFKQGDYEIGVYLSGLFAAIAMAYVFGRLDSHYMNVNRWMLAPLYFYAVIQVVGPSLVSFSGQSEIKYQDHFFAAALFLKFYLFFVVNYWLQNGSFEEYFTTASKRV